MSREWTDAELIRVCQEGPFEPVSDEFADKLRTRAEQVPELQQAIERSPQRELLQKLLAVKPPKPARGGLALWSGIAVACLIAGVVIGKAVFKAGSPDVVQNAATESGQTEVAPIAQPTGDPAVAMPATVTQPASEGATPVVAGDPTPKPTANQVAPVVPVTEVWTAALDLHLPPKSISETVWATPGLKAPDQFHPDLFRKWFTNLPGRPFNAVEERVDSRVFTNFNGQARLQAPWVENAVLRMTVYDLEAWAIYVWRGDVGIRLQTFRHRQPQVWAAHRIARPNAQSAAVVGELLTTDCGRWQQTLFGTLELRAEGGQLLLTRGDLPILMLPFENTPDEIVFDGRVKFREISMYRGDALPIAKLDRFQQRSGPNRFADKTPQQLDWKLKKLDVASFGPAPAVGSKAATAVELASTAAVKEIVWSAVEVPKLGLSEVIFRVEHADPGTGIYFGAANGQPQDRLGFVRDQTAGQLALAQMWAGETLIEKPFDPSLTGAPPYVGASQWFRLISGVGFVSVWVSPDGKNWGWFGDHPYGNQGARNASVGIYALPGADRRIRLSHLEVRELPLVAAIADAGVCAQVDLAQLEPLDVRDFGSWLQQVVRTRPKGVDFAAWRRACAVESLRAVPNAVLGQSLLSGLLADGLFGDFDAKSPVARQAANVAEQVEHDLRLLSEASLLHNVTDYGTGIQFNQLWHSVAEKLVALSESQPEIADQPLVVDESNLAILSSRLWTGPVLAITPQDAARRELVRLVQAGRSKELLGFIDRLTYWNTPGHPSQFWWGQIDPLYNSIQWAELSSHRGMSNDQQTRRLNWPRRWKAVPAPLRHSLAQPLSKEAYNVMAEFQAAISGKAFSDACQVIGSAATGQLLGLLPDSRDDKLLVAFPNAVALAMEEHVELRGTMNDKFGAIGRLRVRQAIESGDALQLEAATVQFFGTVAAAESERWLGDHAFAAGQFPQARNHYRKALAGFGRHSQVMTQDVSELHARFQLVSAMLGLIDTNDLPTSSAFGDESLTKEQLASLTDELVKKSGTVQGTTHEAHRTLFTQPNLMSPNVPPLASYKLEAKGKFDGDLGEHVGNGSVAEIDWFSRQFAIAIDGTTAFLSNRFQLMCLDLTTGQARWTQALGADHANSMHLAHVPMRPLVAANWVFCRRLTKTGPELVCHDKATGNIVWKLKPKALIVSDPILVQGRLQVFVADAVYAGPVDLRLVTLQAETGAVLSEASVVRLYDDPQLAGHPCQAVAHEGTIYFTASGVVGCCDAQGQALWLRKQHWVPPAMDSLRYQHSFDLPLILGDVLIVTQPGVPVIEGLHVRSGRVSWTRSTPDLRRMLGITGERLIVETKSGLEAIDPTTGAIQWRYTAADLLDAIVLPVPAPLPVATTVPAPAAAPAITPTPAPQRILLSRAIDGPLPTLNVPCFVWIDAATGLEAGYQAFDALTDKEPRLGPIIVTPTNTWCFSGKGRIDGRRDLLAMTPTTERGVVRTIDQALWAGWLPEFQRASFVGSVTARPNIAKRTIPQPLRDAVVRSVPGWMIVAPPTQPKEAGLRPDVRGQKDTLAVLLTPRALNDEQRLGLALAPSDAVRLVRQVRVPKVDDAVLKFRVGHEPGQKWQLIVDGGSCRVHSAIVDDLTAPGGWQDLQISLAHLSGSVTEMTITCAPVGAPTPTWVYLANLDGLNVLTAP